MDLKKELCKMATVTGGRIFNTQTFSDFLAYCALRTSVLTNPASMEDRMKQLQQLKKSYNETEWQVFHQTFCSVCDTAKRNVDSGSYEDLFGEAYMELNISNHASGQFFTPKCIARLMAEFTMQEGTELPKTGYFTLTDPACGSGVLLLAGAERLTKCGFNVAMQLVVQAADIDIRCVYMAYLNLSLYGVPAAVIHGNTITLQEFSRWYTPAYILGKWAQREPMPFGNGNHTSNEPENEAGK